MKTWKIPVVWQEMGVVKVEANTLAEAIEIARDDDGVIPIPDNGSFLDGSWEVDCDDEDYLRQFYNDNQEDEIKTKEQIYDEMCRVLTEYENDNDMITENELYDILVTIQNNWETVITKQRTNYVRNEHANRISKHYILIKE